MKVRVDNYVWGLGDQIWMLPILRALHRKYDDIYFASPWPQLYWAFEWIHVMDPRGNGCPYENWHMYRESMESVPTEDWETLPDELMDVVRVCETGDYSTRLRSFYDFDDGPADLSFPLKREWKNAASDWFYENGTARIGGGKIGDGYGKVLLHIPMPPADKRYCDAAKFSALYEAFHGIVRMFDAQRIGAENPKPLVDLDMPIMRSTGSDAPVMWALARLADFIVTTDNHMLPIALALGKPTLYLAGGEPVEYLLDPRINASMVEVLRKDDTDVCAAFSRLMDRSRRLVAA